MRWVAWLALVSASAGAQWTMQESHTTASLRGIHSVDGRVAWAAGTGGTVLRTVDGGGHWQVCAVPDGDKDGAKLDFRGVQGFDASTAIVMSSGKGELSRLYKTADGCGTWTLVFVNPDKEGFWDALRVERSGNLFILGDPVGSTFKIFCRMADDPEILECWNETIPAASPGEGAFAASNSSLLSIPADGVTFFGTGGPAGARVFRACDPCKEPSGWRASQLPMFASAKSAGVFSIALRFGKEVHLVAVGGDYTKPDVDAGTAAYSLDYGQHWEAPKTTPHGYRSAVAYSAKVKAWLTVGPNGTDVSFDDGKNWRALKPGVGDAVDADENWNALSLPFVVGPNGRIGILRGDALARR